MNTLTCTYFWVYQSTWALRWLYSRQCSWFCCHFEKCTCFISQHFYHVVICVRESAVLLSTGGSHENYVNVMVLRHPWSRGHSALGEKQSWLKQKQEPALRGMGTKFRLVSFTTRGKAFVIINTLMKLFPQTTTSTVIAKKMKVSKLQLILKTKSHSWILTPCYLDLFAYSVIFARHDRFSVIKSKVLEKFWHARK